MAALVAAIHVCAASSQKRHEWPAFAGRETAKPGISRLGIGLESVARR
jgi:hypothetical protein